jgi:ABC-type nitrate/sulfonate/bicarbonate transport system ATPase subunit
MKDKNRAGRLILENVTHSYGSVAVIENLNIEVDSGEVVVIVGPSGCGKTTILNLLSAYIQPLSGSVKSIGVIRTLYQQDGLYPWLTVSENIELGLRSISDRSKHEEELRTLIELIHLKDFSNHYPHELSGGMRQRVELARVLAGNSDILLMDEPFSALDYQTRLRMRGEFVRLLKMRPRTVVFVTHDIEEAAQLADRILVLSSRPATICRELIVDAPRPRDLTDPAVVGAMKEILEELGLQSSQREVETGIEHVDTKS